MITKVHRKISFDREYDSTADGLREFTRNAIQATGDEEAVNIEKRKGEFTEDRGGRNGHRGER